VAFVLNIKLRFMGAGSAGTPGDISASIAGHKVKLLSGQMTQRDGSGITNELSALTVLSKGRYADRNS
jgi:hypothetical protein